MNDVTRDQVLSCTDTDTLLAWAEECGAEEGPEHCTRCLAWQRYNDLLIFLGATEEPVASPAAPAGGDTLHQVLDALAERLLAKDAALLEMVTAPLTPDRRAHLVSKAEGVRLALSYLNEVRRKEQT